MAGSISPARGDITVAIRMRRDGKDLGVVGTGISRPNGTWSILTAPLPPPGTHSATAEYTDGFAVASKPVTFDRSAPWVQATAWPSGQVGVHDTLRLPGSTYSGYIWHRVHWEFHDRGTITTGGHTTVTYNGTFSSTSDFRKGRRGTYALRPVVNLGGGRTIKGDWRWFTRR